MKQIQIKEYPKNTISKAKTKKKLTRLEQLMLSDADRRLMYDRRSSHYLLKKQRKTKSPYLSDRKLIKFLLPFSVSLEKKRERSNELYLYNYNNTTKREYMSNEQRYASVVTNLNKIHKNEEIQPDYPQWPQKKPIVSAKRFEKPQQGGSRSNVSAYKPWHREQRPPEDPTDAFMNMTKDNFMNSSEWTKFVALMGKEEAMKWFEAGLKQATQPWD